MSQLLAPGVPVTLQDFVGGALPGSSTQNQKPNGPAPSAVPGAPAPAGTPPPAGTPAPAPKRATSAPIAAKFMFRESSPASNIPPVAAPQASIPPPNAPQAAPAPTAEPVAPGNSGALSNTNGVIPDPEIRNLLAVKTINEIWGNVPNIKLMIYYGEAARIAITDPYVVL